MPGFREPPVYQDDCTITPLSFWETTVSNQLGMLHREVSDDPSNRF